MSDQDIRKQAKYENVHPLRFGDKVVYAFLAAAVVIKIILSLAGAYD